MAWAKYKFFEKGISPEEFNRTKMRDIKEIFDIDRAVSEKIKREGAMNEAIMSMR